MATLEDFTDMLTRLLPPVSYGAADESLQAELRNAAALLHDTWSEAERLRREADPRVTTELLEDFEATYGVPDYCADMAMTVADRRLAVLGKIAEVGGQTPAYFERIARALGYTDARVSEYLAATCVSECTVALGGDDWRNVWSIQSSDATRVTYLDCTGLCTEPLANWSLIEALQCVINRLKPAHTLCYFSFGA